MINTTWFLNAYEYYTKLYIEKGEDIITTRPTLFALVKADDHYDKEYQGLGHIYELTIVYRKENKNIWYYLWSLTNSERMWEKWEATWSYDTISHLMNKRKLREFAKELNKELKVSHE